MIKLLTCVLLWGHLSTHDITEVFQPFLLVVLHFTSKQKAAVRGFYGDTMLPGAIAVGARRQASRDAVTMVLVAQEHLTLGKGILQTETRGRIVVFLRLRATLCQSSC